MKIKIGAPTVEQRPEETEQVHARRGDDKSDRWESTPIEQSATRIIIADDHPLYRDALKRLLGSWSGIRIVGEAANGFEALELCRQLCPDLVLMDLWMPRVDGLHSTRMIKREFPRIVVLILTADEEPARMAEALRAGASGYVIKYASNQQILNAIKRVMVGDFPINEDVAARLLLRLCNETPKEGIADPVSERPSEQCPGTALLEALTSRELEVLRLVARGQTNREIARNLLVGTTTIKKHIHQIIRKLEVSDRTHAAVRAIELGLPLNRTSSSGSS